MSVYIFSGCCKNKSHGKFYLSEQAKEYICDTSATFYMRDNYGITEQFYLNNSFSTSNFLHLSTWSEADKCGEAFATEDFTINYISAINRFFYSVWISTDGQNNNSISIEWQNSNINVNSNTGEWEIINANYNFNTQEYYSTPKGIIINIAKNIIIGDSVYKKILIIDYSKLEKPVSIKKLYYAPKIGLVKYELNNGIHAERKF